MAIIYKAKADMAVMFNAPEGRFFVGESGTEVLFRLIRTAIMGTQAEKVFSSTAEHPATRSAAAKWSQTMGKAHAYIHHDDATGAVGAEMQTSPVMGMDVAGVSMRNCAVDPNAYMIVDGIQHAAHGQLDIASYEIDGNVVSPCKVFSRH